MAGQGSGKEERLVSSAATQVRVSTRRVRASRYKSCSHTLSCGAGLLVKATPLSTSFDKLSVGAHVHRRGPARELNGICTRLLCLLLSD